MILVTEWFFTMTSGDRRQDMYLPPESLTPYIIGPMTGDITTGEGEVGYIDMDRIVARNGDILVSSTGKEFKIGDPKADYEARFPDSKNRILFRIDEQIRKRNNDERSTSVG